MNEPASAPATPAAPAPVSAVESIYGTPKPAAPAATPEPTPAPVAAADPAPTDPPADPAAPVDPNATVVEEVELKSLSELAEHFELDPEWLKTLKVSEKVNGAPVEFSIEEALATHRKVQAADTYLADAKQKSKALIDESTQQREAWAASVAAVGALLQEVEADITRETGELTDKLKQRDPAMYALKQNEIRDRKERLAALRTKAQEGIREAAQKTHAEQINAMQQRLPQEREALLGRVPEWADESKASVEQGEVHKYLKTEGFTDQDIMGIAHNGRALAMAVKAMRYDSAKTKSEAIKKKVVKIPKVLKPGPKPTTAPKPNGAAAHDPVTSLYGPYPNPRASA